MAAPGRRLPSSGRLPAAPDENSGRLPAAPDKNAKPRRLLVALAGLALLAALVGCGTVKSPTEPPPGSASGALTFTQIQNGIFSLTCAKAGCHNAASAQEGMVLEAGVSYGLIVGHPATEAPSLQRVKPGDPEHSYLLKKLRGDPDITGSRMPLSGPPFLTPQQIAGIAAWIQAGAPNN
ncbi:MAG TPA: hypothetical protein VHR45_10685 [Thermoanaerobaculia bacterium]|nr:hypothetical protein [Thermoanaerobaculia bacterium]